MSSFTRFTAALDRKYDQQASIALGKRYWRIKGFRYYIGHEGSNKWVDVPDGFLSDGASVPFVMQWLLPAWGEYGQSAVLHDWLCEHMEITVRVDGVETKERIDRKEVDRILYESMRVLNVKAWRRVLIQGGVDGYRIVTNPTKPNVSPIKLQIEASYAQQHAVVA